MEEKKKKGEKAPEQEEVVVNELEELQKKNEELQKQADEYKDKWIRNVAEFDNYKKRTATQWAEAFNEGVSSVIIKILPVGDNLDWALTLGLDEKTAEGIKKVRSKFDDTLKSLEIEEINPVGEVFDPQIAETFLDILKNNYSTIKEIQEKLSINKNVIEWEYTT